MEAFAARVMPGSPNWGWRRPWGLGSGARFGDLPAGGVGEPDAVVEVGVAGDAETLLVVEPVVCGAEADEVPGVGGSVVGPVDDVVDFDVAVLVAAGNSATTVAVFDEAARAIGHDVL